MNQPPLNPDALDKAALAMCHYVVANREMGHGIRPVYHQYQSAKAAVSAYLAVALPEVTSVESIPAKMRMLMWEGGEIEVGEIPDGYVLVGFEMETDRAWSMADKVTINIERPEVNDA